MHHGSHPPTPSSSFLSGSSSPYFSSRPSPTPHPSSTPATLCSPGPPSPSSFPPLSANSTPHPRRHALRPTPHVSRLTFYALRFTSSSSPPSPSASSTGLPILASPRMIL